MCKHFNFRLEKDIKNNSGQTIKRGEVVKVTNVNCEPPYHKPTCHIEKDGILIYISLRDLFK